MLCPTILLNTAQSVLVKVLNGLGYGRLKGGQLIMSSSAKYIFFKCFKSLNGFIRAFFFPLFLPLSLLLWRGLEELGMPRTNLLFNDLHFSVYLNHPKRQQIQTHTNTHKQITPVSRRAVLFNIDTIFLL